ncbi:hypothetical protein SAMD00023353_4400230 [Rosellinia necatrix]|uniref:Uncharacterized protein n=1 Tax=Rosellinia necatrix TaxID=77044 RepID=A0A1W2TNH2_ROSNE|nr:hypothetical protein SAMD00023353_4400230 [Rosellinia necatrix]
MHRPPRQIQRGPAPATSATPSMPATSARSSWTTPKRMIWTGAFAVVTIISAIYGAGLKAKQEFHAEKKTILEAPVEERIRVLEEHRSQLVNQRRPLERKLEQLRLRVQKETDSVERTNSRP